jgi:hypothetical protein
MRDAHGNDIHAESNGTILEKIDFDAPEFSPRRGNRILDFTFCLARLRNVNIFSTCKPGVCTFAKHFRLGILLAEEKDASNGE